MAGLATAQPASMADALAGAETAPRAVRSARAAAAAAAATRVAAVAIVGMPPTPVSAVLVCEAQTHRLRCVRYGGQRGAPTPAARPRCTMVPGASGGWWRPVSPARISRRSAEWEGAEAGHMHHLAVRLDIGARVVASWVGLMRAEV